MKNKEGPHAFEELLKRHSFDLPAGLIAARARKREDSRLLVLRRQSGTLEDAMFSDLPDLLGSGAALFRNTTRVSKRRLFLHRKSGGRLECLFLQAGPDLTWDVLIKKAAKIKPGEELIGPDEKDVFRFQGRKDSICCLKAPFSAGEAESYFEKYGELPLPPYFKRKANITDSFRYQTVYSHHPGSVAAPTAGLHFTPELFDELERRNVLCANLDLEIGYGTFAPLKVENYLDNLLHEEAYTIPLKTAGLLEDNKLRKIAAGTTTLRALESFLRTPDRIPGRHTTTLFLKPPDSIASIQGLITNFHLPESSLLLLVACFAGSDFLMEAYRHAIARRYLFYSYGDAMLIL